MSAASDRAPGERVWYPLVRLTHWAIAAAIVLNSLIVDEHALVHVWIGYSALSLLGLRLLWGLVGPQEARFAAFPPKPRAAWRHAVDMFGGRAHAHRSHNPLGALMVYALWATLLVVSISGIALRGEPFPEHDAHGRYGAPYDVVERGAGGEDWIEEVHEVAAHVLLALAAMHVAGVALESRLSGRNLVGAMITGVRSSRREP
ncbi:MAG: cytochrome b/b6 domain-containing protein [Geminicoccaceae bacterium]